MKISGVAGSSDYLRLFDVFKSREINIFIRTRSLKGMGESFYIVRLKRPLKYALDRPI